MQYTNRICDFNMQSLHHGEEIFMFVFPDISRPFENYGYWKTIDIGRVIDIIENYQFVDNIRNKIFRNKKNEF